MPPTSITMCPQQRSVPFPERQDRPAVASVFNRLCLKPGMMTIATESRSTTSPPDRQTPTQVSVTSAPPDGWDQFLSGYGYDGFHLRSEWSVVFAKALRHRPHFLAAVQDGRIVGVLPLMEVSGPIFGRFLVSQPYLNSGGVIAQSHDTARQLIDTAIELADARGVKHLELRHEATIAHPRLRPTNGEKVHMRLALPSTSEQLWTGLKSKLRSQVKKPMNDPSLSVVTGHLDQLDAFYDVFCRNMRDLGTPPFTRELFRQILIQFGDRAEITTVRHHDRPIAAGLLLHAPDVTLIPSASSLREFSHTACNMLLYWHCLRRSVERGQSAFDFGRSTRDGGTFKFKQQWGAEAIPTAWQTCSRTGSGDEMRPSSGRFDKVIALWQRLPVWLTRLIGPEIVRGIP